LRLLQKKPASALKTLAGFALPKQKRQKTPKLIFT
jgi:hypothetical protein